MTASENDRPRSVASARGRGGGCRRRGGCALKTWHDDGGGKVPRGTAGRPPRETVGRLCPIQWESHMEEEPFQNAAVEVRILLWIIYELRRGEKKSAIDSSCASNGFGL